MRFPAILSILVMLVSLLNNAAAASSPAKRKVENTAQKFEGTWQVEAYDVRDFVVAPPYLSSQLQKEAEGLPIGQRVRFERAGEVVLPGSIDPTTMTATGPVGAEMNMMLLPPYSAELCRHTVWYLACKSTTPSSNEVMIDAISNWRKDTSREYAEAWDDLQPLEYSLLRLNKTFHFNVRFANNGDLFIMVLVDGRVKGRGTASDSDASAYVGVRLKRVKK